MGYSVRVTEAFEDDLFGVLAYLIEACGANGAAERIVQEVDRAKALLAVQPFIRAASKKSRLGDFAYREHFIKGYVIVYRMSGEEVLFLRFFHQTQLYERFVMEWDQ
ncbi:type II toxin-antitoxin system RelE/ParE family toxin [Eggerthella sinensis]|uniref:type II toxin-antitoxin system RelE/ParE family toxin n=1 Tax=Eggerthella sinensis TaxID=242230 RepID=UPI0022E7A9FB|nr:type II toxin-antitoxin system RelE/ParE family toxin [Eggerthella sinensis]